MKFYLSPDRDRLLDLRLSLLTERDLDRDLSLDIPLDSERLFSERDLDLDLEFTDFFLEFERERSTNFLWEFERDLDLL